MRELFGGGGGGAAEGGEIAAAIGASLLRGFLELCETERPSGAGATSDARRLRALTPASAAAGVGGFLALVTERRGGGSGDGDGKVSSGGGEATGLAFLLRPLPFVAFFACLEEGG